MKPNNFLIPVSVNGHALWLPCNGRAIADLAIARICEGQLSKSDLVSFLVANPGLLLSSVSAIEAGETAKASSFRHWFQSFDVSALELRAFDSIDSRATIKFWKRLAKSKTNEEFWKSVQRFIVRTTGRKFKAKPKRLCRLSQGLVHSIAGAARRLEKSNATASLELDLPDVLAKLKSLQEIKADFEAELLRQKMDSMRLLAYGASHEINNPLANVATRAQSLLKDEPDLKRRHRLAVIYEQAMRAHEMISDMMLFAHPPALELSILNLSVCTSKVIEELTPQLERANVHCEVRGSAPSMSGDATKLSSAIKSLLSNSLEAIGADGKVVIELGEEDHGGIWMSVSDDGPGVDESIRENIFDPFFSGREAGRGLGFGLSKVWRILQLHDATIERTTSELGGAKFVIRFSKTMEIESKPCLAKSIAA